MHSEYLWSAIGIAAGILTYLATGSIIWGIVVWIALNFALVYLDEYVFENGGVAAIISALSNELPEPSPVLRDEHESNETPAPVPEVSKQPKGVLIGEIDGNKASLILPSPLRTRHLYLIGKTRTGKTTLIKNLIIQDMQQAHGMCFIDPHGDAAEELLANVPPERIKDVIYFDPSRTFSPSFNFFRLPFPPYKLTEDVVAVFKMFFGSAWGPRMEHLLRFSVLTLLSDEEPHTLPDLRRLCINADFRAEIASRVQDPAIREFWEHEFPTIEKGAFNPIINKLSAFLMPSSPLLRVFSEKENDLDFSAIMNRQKLLIVNLAKGVLGNEPSRLLGGLIVTGIQQAALARADIPPDQRKEFHLYIDEFQNFVVDSISTILSESAKYRLFLTLAHQTLGQLPTGIERSIFGNVATLISFQVSAEDAITIKREMHGKRPVYREKHSVDYRPLDDLIAATRERYQSSIQSWQSSISEATRNQTDKARLAEKEEKYRQQGQGFAKARQSLVRDIEGWNDKIRIYRNSIQGYRKAIKTLDNPAITIQQLRTFLGSSEAERYDFSQADYPEAHDFINMQARHAFCRMERADNLTAFRTVAPPDPVAGIKGQILHAMRERHAERAKANAPKPQPHTEEQPAVAVGAEYAQAAEPRHEPPHLRVVKGGRGSTQSPTRKKPSTEEEFDF